MLWTQVAAFAGYGFNQGHATAYADVSYRSAYLKTHYPAEFLCARLADWGGFHHQAIYIAEARRLGIAVRPPHVNYSGPQFTLVWEGEGEAARPVLWMGLGQVRDLRRSTVAALIEARAAAPFRDVDDQIRRVQPAAKECRHLIQCGGLDGLGESRRAMLAAAEDGQRGQSALQMSFDFAVRAVEAEALAERLQWEQRILGMPMSGHAAALEAMPSPGTLAAARRTPGRAVTLHGVRLPGWTGGKGWFLAVGDDYAVAMVDQAAANPRPWRPFVARGAWQQDQWGNGWLQVASWSPLKVD
jgi:DNA polymerase III alpha subunit